MFTCRWLVAAVGVSLAWPLTAASQEGPDLGVEATPEEVAGWNISVGPDGAGLPPGSGTPDVGAEIFAVQCAACHGPQGEGLLNDRLVGGHGSLASDAPIQTIGSYWPYATTIFDYVRRAMPYQTPQTLTNDEVYALTAHLLHLNGIIGANDVIDAQTLPTIEMPNRDGFDWVYAETE